MNELYDRMIRRIRAADRATDADPEAHRVVVLTTKEAKDLLASTPVADDAQVTVLRGLIKEALSLWPGARATADKPYEFNAYDDWEVKARAALSVDGSEVLERLREAEREKDRLEDTLASQLAAGDEFAGQLEQEIKRLEAERDRMLAAVRAANESFEQIDGWLFEENPAGGAIPHRTIQEWQRFVRSIPGVLDEQGEKK